jgi:ABC-2 type transport system permease protein
MPPWLTTVSAFSPVRWAIVALEGALWRGASWGELAMPMLSLCALGAVSFALAAQVLRMREA